MKRKGCESMTYWTHYVTLNFDLTNTLDIDVFWFSSPNFNVVVFQEWMVLFDLNWKGYETTAWCLLCVTLTFGLTHYIDIRFSGWIFEINHISGITSDIILVNDKNIYL